ncbi:MAG: PfkB family carbohydrate kinase, partial [Terriglobus sp.]
GIASSRVRSGVTVSVSTREDRSFFTFRGANVELDKRLLEDADLLRRASNARHVHLALPLSASLAAHALPLLRAARATTSLDVGHHVGWLRDEANLDVLRSIDYTMPNEKEAGILSGSTAGYLAQCRSLGLQNALVKLGSQGAVMLRNGAEFRATSPDVPVVDTTGAGDVFDAGFIDALLDNKSPQEMLEEACICGALSTRAPGALRALPTRNDIRTMIQENYAA